MGRERCEVVLATGGLAIAVIDEPTICLVVDDVIVAIVGVRTDEKHAALQRTAGWVGFGEDSMAKLDLVDAMREVGDGRHAGNRQGSAEMETVGAGSASEQVGAAAAIDSIVSGSAVEIVGLGSAEQRVVAGAAIHRSGSPAGAQEQVVASAKCNRADGRTPYAELGKAVGLAVSSVNERVRKLTERGIISGVHAHVAPEALQLSLLALVFVGWSDAVVEDRFLARIKEEPAVLECHHVTGAWNYLLKVRVRDTLMLENFLVGVIKPLGGVVRTETLVVLSTAKETAQLATEPPAWAPAVPFERD